MFSNQYFVSISPMHATSSAHLNLLDLSTLTIFGETCRLWSTSLCSIHTCPRQSNFTPITMLIAQPHTTRLVLFLIQSLVNMLYVRITLGYTVNKTNTKYVNSFLCLKIYVTVGACTIQ
jgi:hypothetical protein